MQQHTGGISRFTLSFDMTFFALVRMALEDTDMRIRKRRCFVHPVRKRPMMDDNDALSYAAYVSGVLTYYKLEDTVADEKGGKRLAALLLRPYAKRIGRRALRACCDIDKIVADAMQRLSQTEKENCPTPDIPADIFGEMLGKLLSYGLTDAVKARIGREIGLHTGRWVYLTDAVFDYEDDIKNDSYNPFRFAFSDSGQMRDFKESYLRGIMTMEADAIIRAVNLLDFDGRVPLRSCIENIIYDGMESAISVAYGKELEDGERSL